MLNAIWKFTLEYMCYKYACMCGVWLNILVYSDVAFCCIYLWERGIVVVVDDS